MDRVNPTRKYNTINFSISKSDAHASFFAVASLLLLCSLLFVPISADAAALSKPPNNLGLVGYWSFDEGAGDVATDFSGNGNHGSLVNGPQWVNGKLGNILAFDGSGDHISLTSTSIIPTAGDFSIAFWVNADATPNGEDRVMIGTGAAAGQRNYIYTTTTFGSASNQLRVWFGDSEILVGNDIRGAGWKHVVITRSGNSWVLYEGGEVVDTETSAVTLASYSEFRIGGGTDADARWHSGGIDEVRIYSRALTATEVAGLNKSGVARIVSSSQLTAGTSLEEGLVGHWTFDSRDLVENVADVSGNGNHGNLVDFPATSSAVAIGKLGQALAFNARHIRIGTANWSGTTGSFSFWAHPTTNPSGASNYFLCHNTLGAGGGCGSGNRIYGRLSDGTLRLGLGSTGNINTGLTFDINQWVHFTVTYNSGSWVAYKNGGQAVANGSYSGTPTIQTSAFIGADPATGGATHFTGIIDDARIYNRALSADEVKRLANLGQAIANAPSQTLQRGTSLADGLQGHWTFDGPDVTITEAFDVSGNGNTGTIFGATPAIGKLGQALEFQSEGTAVEVSADPSIDDLEEQGGGGMTAAAWVYARSAGGQTFGRIFEKGRFNIGQEEDDEWLLRINGSGLGLNFQRGFGTANLVVISSSGALSLNTWHHVAVTWDGPPLAANVHMYVDGEEVAYSTQADGEGSKSSDAVYNLLLGAQVPPVGDLIRGWDGFLDDMRLYNRILSEAEIKQLYRMGR